MASSFIAAFVLCLFAFTNSQCLGPQGNAVNYWFLYKLPNSTANNLTYLYYDDTMNATSPLKISSNFHQSPLYLTVFQLQNQSFEYVVYSNFPPGSKAPSTRSPQISGILGSISDLDDKGFWIFHTFPQLDLNDWKAPVNIQMKAFNAMCSSVNNGFEAASLLQKVAPVIQTRKGLQVTDSPQDFNGVNGVILSSKTSFAFVKKSRKQLDLWQYIRDFGYDLYVKTPIIPGAELLVSTAGLTNVMALGYENTAWLSTHDDSQWSVSRKRNLVCMGDTRNEIQLNYNGIAICIFDENLAKMLLSMIVVIDNQFNATSSALSVTMTNGKPIELTKGKSELSKKFPKLIPSNTKQWGLDSLVQLLPTKYDEYLLKSIEQDLNECKQLKREIDTLIKNLVPKMKKINSFKTRANSVAQRISSIEAKLSTKNTSSLKTEALNIWNLTISTRKLKRDLSDIDRSFIPSAPASSPINDSLSFNQSTFQNSSRFLQSPLRFNPEEEIIVQVIIFNVGTGACQAIKIFRPKKPPVHFLVDCGSRGYFPYKIGRKNDYQRLLDIISRELSYVNWLVVSHPDADHLNFVPRLVDNGLVIEQVFLGYYSEERYKSIQTTIDSLSNEDVFLLNKNQKYELPITLFNEEGVEVRVIAANVGEHDNEGSAVVQVGFGKHSMLLMGDAEGSTTDYILDNQDTHLLHTNFKHLVLAHHGSETEKSNNLGWLHFIRPRTIYASAGVRSGWKHPNKDIVERVQSVGTLISAPEHSASYFDGATHVSEKISIGYYNTFHGDIYITWSLEEFLVEQNGREMETDIEFVMNVMLSDE